MTPVSPAGATDAGLGANVAGRHDLAGADSSTAPTSPEKVDGGESIGGGDGVHRVHRVTASGREKHAHERERELDMMARLTIALAAVMLFGGVATNLAPPVDTVQTVEAKKNNKNDNKKDRKDKRQKREDR